jgi:hypothetical protein
MGRPDDDEGVTHPQVRPDPAFGLLKLYDDALPHVYDYLLARCGDTGLAEELTAESFLAAVHAARKPGAPASGSQPTDPGAGTRRRPCAGRTGRITQRSDADRGAARLPSPP